MSNKRVAGTIILNLENGNKKFLIRPLGDDIEFVMTKVSEEMTGLASMLYLFQEEIQLDVTNINLVELTNAHIDKENLPLFVFEMEEKNLPAEINSNYAWAEPAKLKTLWTTYEIEGVPMF